MAREKMTKGAKIYGIFLALYIVLLAAAGGYVLRLAWQYAKEYEASRPENTIEAYVARLNADLWDQGMEETLAQMPHEMQTDAEAEQVIRELLQGGIRYARTADSAAGGRRYELTSGGSVFGWVELREDTSQAEQSHYGLLPWVMYKEEFDFTKLYSSVEITVPESFTVTLNGRELGSEYIVADGIEYDVLSEYYGRYENLPTKVTYRFENILGQLDPVIFDEAGNEFTPDTSLDDGQYLPAISEADTARLEIFAKLFAERYSQYMEGVYEPSYGYQRIAPYIRLGSELDEQLQAAQEGITWLEDAGFMLESVELRDIVNLGKGNYILDLRFVANTAVPPEEEPESEEAEEEEDAEPGSEPEAEERVLSRERVSLGMRIAIADAGDDIRASMIEIYENTRVPA